MRYDNATWAWNGVQKGWFSIQNYQGYRIGELERTAKGKLDYVNMAVKTELPSHTWIGLTTGIQSRLHQPKCSPFLLFSLHQQQTDTSR